MTSSSTPVSIGPRLADARTVRAGQPSDLVVECGLVDISLANLPTSVVFCYPHQLDVDRLADGLAVALDRLPVFGGRLRTSGDSLQIVCDDSGVPLDSYRVDEDLPEAIARMTLPESGFVDHVQAARARLADLPLLTVRVSELSDGATAVGCSWHHAVGDLQSFLLFMHTWSAACRNLPLPEAVLVADRDGQLLAALPERDSGRPSFRLPDATESELHSPADDAGGSGQPDACRSTSPTARSIGCEPTSATALAAGCRPTTRCARTCSAPSGNWTAASGSIGFVLPVNVRRHLGAARRPGRQPDQRDLPRLRRRRHGRAVGGRHPERQWTTSSRRT